MPDEEAELIRLLSELGLTLTEARVYLGLLQSSDLTATQAADRAGVPRPKVYEALRTLEERGFCLSLAGGTARFRALPAERPLTDLAHEREYERQLRAERDQELVRNLLERLPEPLSPNGDALRIDDQYLEAVFGRSRTGAALERVISHAERELSMMQQPPFLQPRARWGVAELAAIKRGVKTRIIVSEEGARESDRYAPLVAAGAEVRVTAELPMKICIADGMSAMLSLRDPVTHEQSLTSMIVRHPDLVAALGLTFETQWVKAEPFE